MNSSNELRNNRKKAYDPSFRSFPLADHAATEKESKATLPSLEDVKEVKEWVDFKQM